MKDEKTTNEKDGLSEEKDERMLDVLDGVDDAVGNLNEVRDEMRDIYEHLNDLEKVGEVFRRSLNEAKRKLEDLRWEISREIQDPLSDILKKEDKDRYGD